MNYKSPGERNSENIDKQQRRESAAREAQSVQWRRAVSKVGELATRGAPQSIYIERIKSVHGISKYFVPQEKIIRSGSLGQYLFKVTDVYQGWIVPNVVNAHYKPSGDDIQNYTMDAVITLDCLVSVGSGFNSRLENNTLTLASFTHIDELTSGGVPQALLGTGWGGTIDWQKTADFLETI